LLSLLATPIKRDLVLSDTQFSILVGFMFVLFYLGVGIPISRFVDRGPRKWIIGAGIFFYMRVVLWASWGVVPFAILFPLMPTPTLALAMLGASLFFASVGGGPGNAAIQVVTPARMRGTVSALYIAVFNLIGYGLGPWMVARLTDGLFRDESRLPASLAITAAVLGPLGLLLSYLALRPYGAAVRHAEGS
jgi:MFS family permease